MKRILLLMSGTDGGWAPYGHPFPRVVPLLCKQLLDGGFEVEIATNVERLRNPHDDGINSFDVVVVLGRFRGRDYGAEQALRDFIARGRGLVVLHIASSSFPGSALWRELAGRVWVYAEDYPDGYGKPSDHPPLGPFAVRVVDRQHPIMQGVSDFEVTDELYRDLEIHPGSQPHVLALATDPQTERDEPMAFTLSHGEDQGRIFHTTLGHDPSTFGAPMFQRMLIQGIEWAAKLR